jgi:hypothetical protein
MPDANSAGKHNGRPGGRWPLDRCPGGPEILGKLAPFAKATRCFAGNP